MIRPEGPWHIVFESSAGKELRKLDRPVQKKIVAAIESLAADPRPQSATQLVGETEYWRLRVGDYRIIYTFVEDRLIITVVRMAHRREVY
ncbi:type II toxin-antitoxin system RelE/ParE family toxin [Dactylosporangium sp. NPDC050688]|uniref:type II toxin-antitoxin system RelE family toxin n=1 Tax=Dactylosporangium sp. NPDC050688 TaxID=3157217 RepID=UPI0033EC85FC